MRPYVAMACLLAGALFGAQAQSEEREGAATRSR